MEIHAVRASGPGGQHVNKTASAVHLHYDLNRATLPEAVRKRLLSWHDQRIGQDGVIVIKARQYRSFERNRAAAIDRLRKLIAAAAYVPKPRKATRPSKAAQRRGTQAKQRHSRQKSLRRRDPRDD